MQCRNCDAAPAMNFENGQVLSFRETLIQLVNAVKTMPSQGHGCQRSSAYGLCMVEQSVFADAIDERGPGFWYPTRFHCAWAFEELVPETVWYPCGHECLALCMPGRDAVQFGIGPFEFVRELIQSDKFVDLVGWQASGCQVVAAVHRSVLPDEINVVRR